MQYVWFFENMMYPLVGLSILVDIVDVDEHDLKIEDL